MRLSPWLAAAPLVLGLIAAAYSERPGRLPAIVFVSRAPLSDARPGAVPGLGPHDRAAIGAGTLLVRESNGTIRPLTSLDRFRDVADPCVSWDGKQVVFAARTAHEPFGPYDARWRLYVINADGTNLRQLTRDDRPPLTRPADAQTFADYDDLDPCWLPDGRIVFSSTRYPMFAQQNHERTTELFVTDSLGSPPHRITSERNGADEPSIDPRTGRIVYARWWFNRYLATEREAIGVTTSHARAVQADSVNLWHALTILPDGDRAKLAGGNPRVRAETEAYQPIVLREGTLIGVRGTNLGLSPAPGQTWLQAFPTGFAEPVVIAGGPKGGNACAPVALPDGRILFSYDPERTGDYGLYVARLDGSHLAKVLDPSGNTLQLDAAILAPRPRPPILTREFQDLVPRAEPVQAMSDFDANTTSFRFDCMNVFANAPVDVPIPDAPPLDRDVRIRFYATLSRPRAAGGDTVVLVRESHVYADGGIHEDTMPADTPMFEQLVDAHGHVLRSPTGPAHVSGLNAGRFGSGTQCVGCHAGHSAQAVPVNYERAKRFNASPSAEVEASSVAEGSTARAVIDRRTIGPTLAVNWVAAAAESQTVHLHWRTAIAVDSLVLYSPRPDPAGGTNLRIQVCSVVLLRQGREVSRLTLQHGLSPTGTRLACGGVAADAIEVSPIRVLGRVAGLPRAALAEIETIARLIEE